MKIRLIVILTFMLPTTGITAALALEKQTDTIPFIIYNQNTNLTDKFSATAPQTAATSASVANIPMLDIQNIIKKTKDTICKSAENSDVKIWLSVDAGAKISGIGIAGQSGIEIKFTCHKK